jgi:uncharacterized BrkB/YihY/UPF0761 family membrane protein
MRQQHVSSITQMHTLIPSADALDEIHTRTTRRVARARMIVLRLTLGMGVVILLALLNAWLSPSTRATLRDSMFAGQSRVQTSSPEAQEDFGLTPLPFDDFWARL